MTRSSGRSGRKAQPTTISPRRARISPTWGRSVKTPSLSCVRQKPEGRGSLPQPRPLSPPQGHWVRSEPFGRGSEPEACNRKPRCRRSVDPGRIHLGPARQGHRQMTSVSPRRIAKVLADGFRRRPPGRCGSAPDRRGSPRRRRNRAADRTPPPRVPFPAASEIRRAGFPRQRRQSRRFAAAAGVTATGGGKGAGSTVNGASGNQAANIRAALRRRSAARRRGSESPGSLRGSGPLLRLRHEPDHALQGTAHASCRIRATAAAPVPADHVAALADEGKIMGHDGVGNAEEVRQLQDRRVLEPGIVEFNAGNRGPLQVLFQITNLVGQPIEEVGRPAAAPSPSRRNRGPRGP